MDEDGDGGGPVAMLQCSSGVDGKKVILAAVSAFNLGIAWYPVLHYFYCTLISILLRHLAFSVVDPVQTRTRHISLSPIPSYMLHKMYIDTARQCSSKSCGSGAIQVSLGFLLRPRSAVTPGVVASWQ